MPRFTVRNAVIAINIVLFTALFVHLKYEFWDKHAPAAEVAGPIHLPDELLDDVKVDTRVKPRRTAVVVASQASENATWLNQYFPDWEQNIYQVDDPNAPLTVPRNKGRESMVYLTYVLPWAPPSLARALISNAGTVI